jgi:hypothetical protein
MTSTKIDVVKGRDEEVEGGSGVSAVSEIGAGAAAAPATNGTGHDAGAAEAASGDDDVEVDGLADDSLSPVDDRDAPDDDGDERKGTKTVSVMTGDDDVNSSNNNRSSSLLLTDDDVVPEGGGDNIPPRSSFVAVPVARPVKDEGDGAVTRAEPVVGMSKRQKLIFGLAVGLLLAAALAVGLAVGLTRPGPSTANSTTTTTPIAVNDELLAQFQASLPAEFVAAIRNASTPHSRAYEWLRNHQQIEAVDDKDAVRRLRQRFALASFYYSTGGVDKENNKHAVVFAAGESQSGAPAGGWNNHTGWLEYTESECNWYGCTCNTSSKAIEALDLARNNLAGRLSSPAFELHLMRESLTVLWLYSNSLSGPVPSELGRLSGLEFALLSDNQFSGTIPAELGNLSSLRFLLLHKQSLTGTIPSDLGRLSNLLRLDLSGNRLTGTLPSEIGQMSSLLDLNLYKNQRLNGTIPTWWASKRFYCSKTS